MGTDQNAVIEIPDLSRVCLAMMEHAPSPMAAVEGATHIVMQANPAFCRLMGEKAEVIVGRPLSELLSESDECVRLLDRVLQTGAPESHTEQEDSNHVFWSYTMWPVMDDARVASIVIQVSETAVTHRNRIAVNQELMLSLVRQHELAEDAENLNAQLRAEIAERKQANEALRSSETRFRALFELGPVAVYSCDSSGIIQDYNRRAAELWGRTPALGDSSERFCGSLRMLRSNGSYLPHGDCPMGEVVSGRISGVHDAEVHIERPDGSIVVVIVNIIPLKNEGGEITGAINCFYDITDRRALEDALAVRAEELARADRSKDEFLAMLAHELRNPLASLSIASVILKTAETSNYERGQAQGILDRSIVNMSRMIDDLLDVSRITEGKIELRKNPVTLQAILSAATSLVAAACAARHQELAVTMPEEVIFLDADATRLEQVFNNLLTNACKYSGDGSHITLTATRAAGIEPPEIIVCVKDDGLGIEADLLPHIFDLFVQASRTLDRATGGLGIGLTLVQRLVKMHGGTIQAYSEGIGKGAEFTVRLPILRKAPAASPPPPPATLEAPRRILIVDDNIDAAHSLSVLQKRRGHTTCTAYTGPGAIDAAAEFLPEVVLLDIGLPGMDGFEVARRIRRMPALANTLIFAMSGYGSDEDRDEAKLAGFDEYMIKPVDLDKLREWLAKM